MQQTSFVQVDIFTGVYYIHYYNGLQLYSIKVLTIHSPYFRWYQLEI